MAFALSNSLSALLPSSAGAVFNFSVATAVKSVRLTNSHTSSLTFSLWFDYDGTSNGDVDLVAKDVTIAAGESVMLDGGPWHFGASSRISGIASSANKIACHVTPATI